MNYLMLDACSFRRTGTPTSPEPALAVRARNPQHIARTFIVDVAARDEEEIRQPVDVAAHFRGDAFAGVGELDDHALGTPADRARKMQIGRCGRATGKHEGAQR